MSEPLTPEYEAEIREHVATMSNYSLGNLFARDLLAEIDRIRAERDAWHDWADSLAYKVAPVEVLGRHGEEGRFPWSDALDLITPAAEVEQLRARVAELEHERDEHRAAAERAEAKLRKIEHGCETPESHLYGCTCIHPPEVDAGRVLHASYCVAKEAE